MCGEISGGVSSKKIENTEEECLMYIMLYTLVVKEALEIFTDYW